MTVFGAALNHLRANGTCGRQPRAMGTDMPISNGQQHKQLELLCRHCHRQMTLKSIEPHSRYKNLDVLKYACDCGWSLDVEMSRVEKT